MALRKGASEVRPDPAWLEQEIGRLDAEVDKFADQMKARLREKAAAGWDGWDDPSSAEQAYTDMLGQAAGVKFARGQEVDIANLAMFLKRFNDGPATS